MPHGEVETPHTMQAALVLQPQKLLGYLCRHVVCCGGLTYTPWAFM
jgi:hypothetical protein